MKPVTLGHFEATPNMIETVTAILQSGRLSYGEHSRRFEQEFASTHLCEYGVLSNSGTSALVVAIQTLKEMHGWSDGDEVIVPSLTFVATVNAVLHNNLKPVVVDVDTTFFDLDLDQVERAINSRTRALIAVNLFGQPANLPALCNLAQRHHLKVIEDSCESVLVGIDGRPVGSWGDIGCFSLYMAHHITAGVGGVCTTSNPNYALRMRSLVNHGIDLEYLPAGTAYEPSFLARNFSFSSIGHSFRITELEAALALEQLHGLGASVAARQRNAADLGDILHQFCGDYYQIPQVRPNAEHSWMVYPLVCAHAPKEQVKAHLRNWGIECRDLVPLTNQLCYRDLFRELDYPNAWHLNRHGFYVGVHQALDYDDMYRIASALANFMERD
jgi:perosamine synthetase